MVGRSKTSSAESETPISFGVVSNTAELGQLVRAHRKERGLTLEEAAGLANLSVRFFSEFERGKETAEVGKVLKAIRILGLEFSVSQRGALVKTNTANSAGGKTTHD